MKRPGAPRLDDRRAAEFAAELRARARAWLPSWSLADADGDVGRALLDVAARFGSEVAERLDRAGDKMWRGFLDWLAVPREAARPARVPVVFKLVDAARRPVPAPARTRMQVEALGTNVVFETEGEVLLVPGKVGAVVGADCDADAFYLPPPGLGELQPLAPAPSEWRLKSYAAPGAAKLQLDPASGLAVDQVLEAADGQHRIVGVDSDIVAIEPPLAAELAAQAIVRKVTTFAPFDGAAQDQQLHALYLGHPDVLRLDAPATLEIVGAQALRAGVTWQFWGKASGDDEARWQALTPAPDAEQKPDALVLKKPGKGELAPRVVGGKRSLWLRAFTPAVDAAAGARQLGTLALRVNCGGLPACGTDAAPQGSGVTAEGMANTTPLVLDSLFFPLGKEPRQFDAFYLGCQEAFSKEGAEVQLCFEMADPSCKALSVVRTGALEGSVFAGVGRDRKLHLLQLDAASGRITRFQGRGGLQPPSPAVGGGTDPGTPVLLDPQPAWRAPIWPDPTQNGFQVAVSAGDAVWVWRELGGFFAVLSGWVPLGSVAGVLPPAEGGLDGLVYLGGALLALRGEALAVAQQAARDATWRAVDTFERGTAPRRPVHLRSIVPILEVLEGRLTHSAYEAVGVSADGKVHRLGTTGACDPLWEHGDADVAVRPVAVRSGARLAVAFALRRPGGGGAVEIVSYDSSLGTARFTVDEAEATVLGLDAFLDQGVVTFVASVRYPDGPDTGATLLSWAQPAAGTAPVVARWPIPPGAGTPAGAPLRTAQHILVPATQGEIVGAKLDLSQRVRARGPLRPGVVLPETAPRLGVGDVVAADAPGALELRSVQRAGAVRDREVLYVLDRPVAVGGDVLVFPASSARTGARTAAPRELVLAIGDDPPPADAWLLVDRAAYRVDSVATRRIGGVDRQVATLGAALPGGPAAPAYIPAVVEGRRAPALELDPGTNGAWDAGLLDRVSLLFPSLTPARQSGKAFDVDDRDRPKLVALGAEVAPWPSGDVDFVVDAAVTDWPVHLVDTTTNPELSWEYWNGKGWWKLTVTADQTQHLKRGGAVRLVVPDDLAPSDWAGKTNHWIRARLVGGDYGRETVTVSSRPAAGGATEQTVTRSSEGIRAPAVARLEIAYQVCAAVLPAFVLAEDGGSIRDQSDANRTGGAIVEAFVPLAVALGRLSGAAGAAPGAAACAAECPCGCADEGAAPPGAAAPVAGAGAAATGRALLVGLDAAPSGGPVNVLLLVEERDHGALAPMRIEALVADRFVPVLADDPTRALGESGLLSLTFALPPTPRELFGRTLTWLRLTPASGGAGAAWRPALRGVYLNGAWAAAAETLTRELLGSSAGEPGLALRLARPPVLRGTLELRVREPLGEEERAALRAGDAARVVTDPDGLAGDWVRWERVVDPADEGPAARVYALDEATGEIRFGDGQHGMIPPVGQDSIVAFSYRRTETGAIPAEGVPANAVRPRDPLGLVSPVEGVESVIAADAAAGGAPAESDERVLQLGTARLRHRERAVTAADLEDLALASAPDVIQARCLRRRGGLRLVVAVRGTDPRPGAAQLRELRRLLLAAAPATLGADRALRVEGPALRRLRVELELGVARLDDVGAVSREVRGRLLALFDTAGVDGAGWPLGEGPGEEDVVLAVAGAAGVETVRGVALSEIAADGAERAWSGAVAPGELVVLADDGVRIRYGMTEGVA